MNLYMSLTIQSKLLSFLLSLILIFGCKSNSPKTIEFFIKESSIRTTTLKINNIKVTNLKLTNENIYGLFTSISVCDSFLICGNLRSPKLINIYSLKGDTLITEILQRGTGKNEGLSVSNVDIKYEKGNAFLWVYDITMSKLFKMNLLKSIKDSSYGIDKEISLTKELKNIFSPEIINDSLRLATTYSFDDSRYLYANDKIVKKVGSLPITNESGYLQDEENTKFPNKAYIFKSTLVKNPYENKVALFYNKTDRVEFYKNDSLIQIINGPDKFGPKMIVSKTQTGFSIEDFEQTKYAYISITYTPNNIYCLYSGTVDGSSNRIFVFGWDGNFIEELTLNKNASKIFINPVTKILYCYENKENGIFSVKLN